MTVWRNRHAFQQRQKPLIKYEKLPNMAVYGLEFGENFNIPDRKIEGNGTKTTGQFSVCSSIKHRKRLGAWSRQTASEIASSSYGRRNRENLKSAMTMVDLTDDLPSLLRLDQVEHIGVTRATLLVGFHPSLSDVLFNNHRGNHGSLVAGAWGTVNNVEEDLNRTALQFPVFRPIHGGAIVEGRLHDGTFSPGTAFEIESYGVANSLVIRYFSVAYRIHVGVIGWEFIRRQHGSGTDDGEQKRFAHNAYFIPS